MLHLECIEEAKKRNAKIILKRSLPNFNLATDGSGYPKQQPQTTKTIGQKRKKMSVLLSEAGRRSGLGRRDSLNGANRKTRQYGS